MAILRMYQGEKRKLYLSVKSEDNLPFEIPVLGMKSGIVILMKKKQREHVK